MLSLLRNQSTILDYIDTWSGPVCACRTEIDVSWLPDPLDPDGQWETQAWFATRCPECVVRQAPDELQAGLRQRFDRLRVSRHSLGLGSVNPQPHLGIIEPEWSARRSLRWRSGPITVSARTWRGPKRVARFGVVMEQLTLTGTIPDHLRPELNSGTVAPLPWYEVVELGPSVWALGEAAVIVLLGATFYDPARPGLEWHYAWNRHVPASHGFFSLPPWWQEHGYSPGEIGEFVKRAMNLFEMHSAAGRRAKLTVEMLQEFVQEFRTTNNGDDPPQEKLAELADVDSDTIRNTFTREGFSTYRAFLQGVPVRQRKAHTIRARS